MEESFKDIQDSKAPCSYTRVHIIFTLHCLIVDMIKLLHLCILTQQRQHEFIYSNVEHKCQATVV